MSRPQVNRVGERHGHLMVIENLIPSIGSSEGGPTFNYGGQWLCKCDCGKTKKMYGYYLRPTSSCGCATVESNKKAARTRRKSKKGGALVTINFQYRGHKHRARMMKWAFLPREIWESIVFQPCHYCGGFDVRSAATMRCVNKHFRVQLTEEEMKGYSVNMNGVDRIDSSRPYEPDNCVSSCITCNRMKMDMPKSQFENQIRKITLHLASRDQPSVSPPL